MSEFVRSERVGETVVWTVDRPSARNAIDDQVVAELEALLDAAAPHRVEWHWVKGHAGHPENDRADALACAEADARR